MKLITAIQPQYRVNSVSTLITWLGLWSPSHDCARVLSSVFTRRAWLHRCGLPVCLRLPSTCRCNTQHFTSLPSLPREFASFKYHIFCSYLLFWLVRILSLRNDSVNYCAEYQQGFSGDNRMTHLVENDIRHQNELRKSYHMARFTAKELDQS